MKNKKRKSKAEILSYFTPQSDAAFKRRHPIGYGFLVALGIFAFILPLIGFIIYMVIKGDDSFTGGWPILTILGCLVMGVGLFNIVAAIIKQYLGHLLTAICLGGGGLLVALSVFMMENPQLYDEDVSLFYFVSLLFMLVHPIYYFLFRVNFIDYLSRKLKRRERTLRRQMRGAKNLWWYQSIHEENNLGVLYHLNKVFTLLYPVTLGLTLLLGFVRELTPAICTLQIALCAVTAVIALVSGVMDSLVTYGAPIVLFRIHPVTKRIDSFILDLFGALFFCAIGYSSIQLCLKIFIN